MEGVEGGAGLKEWRVGPDGRCALVLWLQWLLDNWSQSSACSVHCRHSREQKHLHLRWLECAFMASFFLSLPPPSADSSPSICRAMLEPSCLAAGDLNHVKVHHPNWVCISPVKTPNRQMNASRTSAWGWRQAGIATAAVTTHPLVGIRLTAQCSRQAPNHLQLQ